MLSVRQHLSAMRPLTPSRVRRCLRFPFPVCLALVLLLGIAPQAIAQPSAASTSSPPAASSPRAPSAHPYSVHVAEASRRFGLPEAWIWSVMRVESAGNPTATSHAGAMGLMQVMPGTYAELRSRHALGPDPYDRRDNILAGAAYLREMLDRYGPTGMLAAYNAGPGRWEDHVSRGRPLPAETVAYMARLGAAVGSPAASSVAPSPTIVAQIDRFAWRRASLFAALDESASASDADAAPVQPEPVVTAAPGEPNVTPKSEDGGGLGQAADTLFAIRRPQ